MGTGKKAINNNFILYLLGRMVSDTGAIIQIMIMPLYIIDVGGSKEPNSDDELESYNEILTYRPENTVAEGNEKNMNQTLHLRKTATNNFKNKKG